MREQLHGDVKPVVWPDAGVFVAPPTQLRVATQDDIEFIRALARELYPGRGIDRGEGWMRWCISNPDKLVIVGPSSVGVASVGVFYGYERRSMLDMLAARADSRGAMAALKTVRWMLKWAAQKGVKGHFRIGSDTGVDFGAFARRLGGEAVTEYNIPISGD